MSPLRIRSYPAGRFPMKRSSRAECEWMDSRCKSLITTALIVSLYSVIHNAEAGHSAKAPGGLEYWSAGVPRSCKIPNSKHQITNKSQISISNDQNRF
jgi:hypothetical protein